MTEAKQCETAAEYSGFSFQLDSIRVCGHWCSNKQASKSYKATDDLLDSELCNDRRPGYLV